MIGQIEQRYYINHVAAGDFFYIYSLIFHCSTSNQQNEVPWIQKSIEQIIFLIWVIIQHVHILLTSRSATSMGYALTSNPYVAFACNPLRPATILPSSELAMSSSWSRWFHDKVLEVARYPTSSSWSWCREDRVAWIYLHVLAFGGYILSSGWSGISVFFENVNISLDEGYLLKLVKSWFDAIYPYYHTNSGLQSIPRWRSVISYQCGRVNDHGISGVDSEYNVEKPMKVSMP